MTLKGSKACQSSKKTHNVSHYAHSRQKTSVVIEKKAPRKWGEKKFQNRSTSFNKPSGDLASKKVPINRNFDIILKNSIKHKNEFYNQGIKLAKGEYNTYLKY